MDEAVVKRVQQINPKKREALTSLKRPSAGMKRLTLDLSEPLHRAIKKNAADEGVTMAQKLRALLSEHYRFPEGRDLSSPHGSTAAEM
jgi:predicted DNA binding CopG/RHH family protein